MSKYQEIRSKISKIDNREGIAKFYSGAIFNQTSWYTSRFEEPEVSSKIFETVESSPRAIERPSAEASPMKKEVLDSLAKKVEESGVVQSKFGNIVKDVRTSLSGSQLKLTQDLSEYKEMIERTYLDFKFDEFKEITTLIVGERTLSEISLEEKHFKTNHDNSELLGKMIIPMKLEEGEFVRTFLVGKSEDEILQNLLSEISLFKPQVVISLGAVSTNFLYGRKEKLSKIHGSEIERAIESDGSDVKFTLFPIFHPDLLEINPSMKRTAWMDLQKVMKYLGKL